MASSSYNINEASEIFHSSNNDEIKVLTVGVFETADSSVSEHDFLYSMQELDELVYACDMVPVAQITQNLDHVHKSLYVGTGKVSEVKLRAQAYDAELVVCNDTLSPSQYRNLQKELGMPVMDRTALIIEIFKKRAKSREAMLQVEYAHLTYIKTRLVGMWDTLGRKGGASGSMSSRGEGETQLELDRRAIDKKLAALRRELVTVKGERMVRRQKREKSSVKLASLIGYTNAGKSTIMNALVDRFSPADYQDADSSKKVFEANMLFATLDSSVRHIVPGKSGDFLLSDTVGFIHKLPTSLVEAFKSTLEEAARADLLIIVVDRSDINHKLHMQVTEEILSELSAGDIPRIIVYNKSDLCDPPISYPELGAERRDGGANGGTEKSIYISAKDSASIDMLVSLITSELYGSIVSAQFLIPYDKGQIVNVLMENTKVTGVDYTENGTMIQCQLSSTLYEKYKDYTV